MPANSCRFTLPEDNLRFIVKNSVNDLHSLRDSHILCTGCTSFFGKWLLESLLRADEILCLGLRLTVLSRYPERFYSEMPHLKEFKQLSCLIGDVTTFAFQGRSPFTHIVHAANLLNDGSTGWPRLHMDTAIDGLRHVMTVAKEHGCTSLLYISSGAVYRAESSGDCTAGEQTAFTERQISSSDNLGEPTVYSVTKRFMEVYATALGAEMNIRVPLARCFAFVGPYMPLDGPQAMGNFIGSAIARQDVIINGDGSPRRSYMYSADLVVWLLGLLVRGRHGIPYNVGSGHAVSILEAAQAVVKCVGAGIKVRVLGRNVEGNAPAAYVPDISRCKDELALECHFGFYDMLQETIRWFESRKRSIGI